MGKRKWFLVGLDGLTAHGCLMPVNILEMSAAAATAETSAAKTASAE